MQFYAAVCVVKSPWYWSNFSFFSFIGSSIFGTVYLFVFGLRQLIGLKNYTGATMLKACRHMLLTVCGVALLGLESPGKATVTMVD